MKKVIVTIINFYQKLPLHTHFMCRFQPTCSEYMKQAVEEYGFKGFLMGLRRLFRCNPFFKSGYDPVPKHK